MMIGFFGCVIVIFIAYVIKRFIFHMNKRIFENDETSSGRIMSCAGGKQDFRVDIICDITNEFGKYYAKKVSKKKSLICIIPVFKGYNEQYEQIDKLNEFMACFSKFLNMKEGKLVLCSENNIWREEKSESKENEEEEEDTPLLCSSILYRHTEIRVCVVNYDKDTDSQFDVFLKNKKNYIHVVINNLFLDNLIFKNKEMLCSAVKGMNTRMEDVSSVPLFESENQMNEVHSILYYINVNKIIIPEMYKILQINLKNFEFFYRLLRNMNSGMFLNMYVSDNDFFSKIYNSIMDIYQSLIYEKIKKDQKKISVKKFYTFINLTCDYEKIVNFTLMQLHKDFLSCYFYKFYSLFYYYLILHSSGKNVFGDSF